MYTEGLCDDGAAILRNGVMVPVEDVVEELNRTAELEAENATLRAKLAMVKEAWGDEGTAGARFLMQSGPLSTEARIEIDTILSDQPKVLAVEGGEIEDGVLYVFDEAMRLPTNKTYSDGEAAVVVLTDCSQMMETGESHE